LKGFLIAYAIGIEYQHKNFEEMKIEQDNINVNAKEVIHISDEP
jgi:hypothetical protein